MPINILATVFQSYTDGFVRCEKNTFLMSQTVFFFCYFLQSALDSDISGELHIQLKYRVLKCKVPNRNIALNTYLCFKAE